MGGPGMSPEQQRIYSAVGMSMSSSGRSISHTELSSNLAALAGAATAHQFGSLSPGAAAGQQARGGAGAAYLSSYTSPGAPPQAFQALGAVGYGVDPAAGTSAPSASASDRQQNDHDREKDRYARESHCEIERRRRNKARVLH